MARHEPHGHGVKLLLKATEIDAMIKWFFLFRIPGILGKQGK